MKITKHCKFADGSYLLCIDPGDGTEREFRYVPLADDATLHEDGPPMTEEHYVAMQIRESAALIEAENASKEVDLGTPLETEGTTI
jgi:hypothetical protein